MLVEARPANIWREFAPTFSVESAFFFGQWAGNALSEYPNPAALVLTEKTCVPGMPFLKSIVLEMSKEPYLKPLNEFARLRN